MRVQRRKRSRWNESQRASPRREEELQRRADSELAEACQGLMKLAYLLHWLEGEESGVFKKVRSQIAEWTRAGNEVRLFVITAKGSRLDVVRDGTLALALTKETYGSAFERCRAGSATFRQVMSWAPDAVYLRQTTYLPAFDKLFKTIPSIVEVNSDDVAEARSRSVTRQIYARATRGRLLRAAAGVVFVTTELSRAPRFARYVKRFTVIPNGIAFDECQQLPVTTNERPRLAFIGSPGQAWQGIDRLLDLARGFPDWAFDVIGSTVDDLPRDETIPANVKMWGSLTRTKYEEVLERADVGVGTLALERKGMVEACPLKVREYLALGLPVIVGYYDSSFPEPVPFVLQMSGPVLSWNCQAIRAFVETWRGKRVRREDVAHLSLANSEANRLEFFREVLAASQVIRA